MPIDNIAFTNSNVGVVTLANFNDVVAVRLRVRDEGKYVIFGRVVISNWDGDAQNASARLTTFDGATELDRADVRVDGSGLQSISLQGTLTLPSPNSNAIVDIRCSTFKGGALESTLFAILVDGLSPSL
jgi:hypothetical protein